MSRSIKTLIYDSHNQVILCNVFHNVFDITDKNKSYEKISDTLKSSFGFGHTVFIDDYNFMESNPVMHVSDFKKQFDSFINSREDIHFDKAKYEYYNTIKCLCYLLQSSEFAISLVNASKYGINVSCNMKRIPKKLLRNNIAAYIVCLRALYKIGKIGKMLDNISKDGIFFMTEDLASELNNEFACMLNNMFVYNMHNK